MMRKSLLFTVIVTAVMVVTGCQQYVPTPGQADMVQYTFIGPEHNNGIDDPQNISVSQKIQDHPH